MTSQEKIELFLTHFKELENHILSLAKIKSEGHVSFSKALNDVYYQRKEPLISQYDNFDFLKTCADLRNILSHENDVCVPSDEFLNKFIKLKESIIHPLTCYDICSKKVYSCKKNDSVLNCLKKMTYYSLSHLPVLDDDNCVQGVFSRETLFDFYSMNEIIHCDEKTKIEEFMEFIPLDEHLNEKYLFVSRNRKVDEICSNLFKSKEHDKNIGLIFVTENGRSTQKLLGVITVTDLAKTRF